MLLFYIFIFIFGFNCFRFSFSNFSTSTKTFSWRCLHDTVWTKIGKRFMFWLLICVTTAFWGPENFCKWVSKCKILKRIPYNLCNQQKHEFEKMVMHMLITCSVYGHSRCICLHSDITSYWPGMNNTACYVVFVDPCERGSFWQHCHQYVKLFKNGKGKERKFIQQFTAVE